ncbi:uncharacterized protein BO72DRAFT_224254 [Aspergillus fijiensis CBS 313.89]|uniref:Uncharacterized protein n=1 Tax=Aspergillus fijiensis CBS 313.89 TaxID=1448319 RepID=A0A8G1RL50_9EURO|nr:uncharacterized protein BO72DRAFT_224254 [Aspergillus fijiensis CBS 313.89]RAK73780.1 hypothetical protein BO72DRAFT_224254 [Aspergillus fijiensis CBS 313.89]
MRVGISSICQAPAPQSLTLKPGVIGSWAGRAGLMPRKRGATHQPIERSGPWKLCSKRYGLIAFGLGAHLFLDRAGTTGSRLSPAKEDSSAHESVISATADAILRTPGELENSAQTFSSRQQRSF